ncbi:MAG TPA: UDP-glucose 4-epimerase GalE [Rhizomicrobium sp.]|nr:UDP-glucose 4-epimerase GalE [Rhizomicrobium sp.]
MRTVLVTGGAGYIGSHVCKALARAGYQPVAYDNLIYGHKSAVKWGPLEVGDILVPSRLSSAIRKYGASAVIHLAAFAYVGESVTDPAKYYKNNVAGTLALLDAMRSHGVGNIVFSSTCATYGIPGTVPIPEDERQNPINPYGASKLMIERILSDYRTAYGLNSISLRYFNAAGADPDGELGEDHDPETHLIPLVLKAASGALPNITVFGDDYETPDGTCIRDYIHVSDLAHAHVMALRKLESGPATRSAYNLGTGRGHSVAEVIKSARRVTGRSIPVIKGPRRAGDPAILLADPTRAISELGISLQFPKIDDMILSAWRWSHDAVGIRTLHPSPATADR